MCWEFKELILYVWVIFFFWIKWCNNLIKYVHFPLQSAFQVFILKVHCVNIKVIILGIIWFSFFTWPKLRNWKKRNVLTLKHNRSVWAWITVTLLLCKQVYVLFIFEFRFSKKKKMVLILFQISRYNNIYTCKNSIVESYNSTIFYNITPLDSHFILQNVI